MYCLIQRLEPLYCVHTLHIMVTVNFDRFLKQHYWPLKWRRSLFSVRYEVSYMYRIMTSVWVYIMFFIWCSTRCSLFRAPLYSRHYCPAGNVIDLIDPCWKTRKFAALPTRKIPRIYRNIGSFCFFWCWWRFYQRYIYLQSIYMSFLTHFFFISTISLLIFASVIHFQFY